MSGTFGIGDIAGILAGVGSLVGGASGLFGAVAKRDATNQSLDIARDQIGLNKEMFDQLFKLNTAPVTDARGNRTSYDPTKGWTTDLSDIGKLLLQSGDQDVLDQLGIRKAQVPNMLDAARRQGTEGIVADSILNKYRNRTPITYESVRGSMDNASRLGIEDTYRDVQKDAIREGMRTGSSAQPVIDALMERKSRELGQALANNAVSARGSAIELDNAEASNWLNQYNLLAGRATGQLAPNTPVVPTADAAFAGALSGRTGANQAGTANAFAGLQGVGLLSKLNDADAQFYDTLGIGLNSAFKGLANTLSPQGRTVGNQTTTNANGSTTTSTQYRPW